MSQRSAIFVLFGRRFGSWKIHKTWPKALLGDGSSALHMRLTQHKTHIFSHEKSENRCQLPISKWPQSVLQILATKFLRSTLTSFGAQPTHFLRTLIMLLLLDFCACVNYCITLELRGGFVQFPPPQKHSLRRRDLFWENQRARASIANSPIRHARWRSKTKPKSTNKQQVPAGRGENVTLNYKNIKKLLQNVYRHLVITYKINYHKLWHKTEPLRGLDVKKR